MLQLGRLAIVAGQADEQSASQLMRHGSWGGDREQHKAQKDLETRSYKQGSLSNTFRPGSRLQVVRQAHRRAGLRPAVQRDHGPERERQVQHPRRAPETLAAGAQSRAHNLRHPTRCAPCVLFFASVFIQLLAAGSTEDQRTCLSALAPRIWQQRHTFSPFAAGPGQCLMGREGEGYGEG